MFPKHLVTAAVAASLIAIPATRASADLHGFVAGAIVGAAINQNVRKKRVVVVNSVSRQQNREAQTALNYFGWPAGSPDGVWGSRSRGAASAYQAFLQFPATGNLNDMERTILVTAYNRALAGAPETVRLISRDPLGPRALLNDQRDIMLGGGGRRTTGYAGLPIEVSEAIDEIADTSDPTAEQLLARSGFIQLADLNADGNNDYILDTKYAGSSFWCGVGDQCKAIIFASTPSGYRRHDLLAFNPTPESFDCVNSSCVVRATPQQVPTPQPAAEPVVTATATQPVEPSRSTSGGGLGGGLGVFQAEPQAASLTSHCSRVELLSAANGTSFSLPELFCQARSSAIEGGNGRVLELGLQQSQIDAQCGNYGPVLRPYVAAVALKPRDEAIGDMRSFVLNSGIDPEQLKLAAQICMAEGYRTDDMDMAIGSGLLLVVLSGDAYSEIIGHHLQHGFGVAKRADRAQSWYQAGLDALAGGGEAVFATNVPQRGEYLYQAVYSLKDGGQAGLKDQGGATQLNTGLGTFQPKQ